MARRKRKRQKATSRTAPHEVLAMLSKEYKQNTRKSNSDAEYEYWMKCAKSTANLSSGMEKWLDEFIDEEEDE